MDKTKKHLNLLYRIKNLNVSLIENMSSDVMANLTDYFEESLVRNVVCVGTTNIQQRNIIKKIKGDYKHWKEKTDILWKNALYETYPGYMENLQLDIECGNVVTERGVFREDRAKLTISFISPTAKPVGIINETIEKIPQEISQSENKIEKKKAERDTLTDTACDNKQESLIKKLEEENKSLNELTKNLQKKLDEANTIPESITAQQRVRMELARLLMEKAGINKTLLDKWGNKDKVGTIMSIILDIPPTTCKTYLSDPTINKGYHEKTISNINTLLEALGLDFKL